MRRRGVKATLEFLSLLQVLEIVVVLNVVEIVVLAAGLIIRQKK